MEDRFTSTVDDAATFERHRAEDAGECDDLLPDPSEYAEPETYEEKFRRYEVVFGAAMDQVFGMMPPIPPPPDEEPDEDEEVRL